MSPLNVRRYRAERLLREQFDRLRGAVLAAVGSRLAARGLRLDADDLEACYAQAWQGLYAAVLDGQQVANPAGWLTLVTFRRAIDEQRASRRHDQRSLAAHAGADDRAGARGARELAEDLYDQVRLRHLLEGLRGRLSKRELQAAALCYLQGLTRAQAAAQMGVSDKTMRRLMEGRGPGSPGVAAKVGTLVAAIRDGSWCEQQGSLMRGLAYGVLDPQGERYRLAMLHRDQCPACRAYVLSLRGLAAALPPVPALLPWALAGSPAAQCAAGAHASATWLGGGVGGGQGIGAPAAPSTGAGSIVAAPAASGAGAAAGGGWFAAGGGAVAKLALGCALAAGVGAGCVALTPPAPSAPPSGHRARMPAGARASGVRAASRATGRARRARSEPAAVTRGGAAPRSLAPQTRASREFGPERALAGVAGARPPARAPRGRGAAARSASFAPARAPVGSTPARPAATAPSSGATGASSSAEREFGVG
jgi:RNA polymerase sigma factor (sigma-70 family)